MKTFWVIENSMELHKKGKTLYFFGCLESDLIGWVYETPIYCCNFKRKEDALFAINSIKEKRPYFKRNPHLLYARQHVHTPRRTK